MHGNYFGIIYKVTNKVNGKVYVGQTTQKLSFRKAKHINRGHYLYNALNRYGLENFNWEIISYCGSVEKLNKMEKYYIKKYNSFSNGYNLTEGGEGQLGVSPSGDVRQKISDSLKGRYCGKENPFYSKKHSEKSRMKMSDALKGKMVGEKNSFYGKKHSQESRKKMSESHMGEKNNNYGKRFSEEHRRKIGESNKGKKMSVETKRKISVSRTGKCIGKDNPNAKRYVITTPIGEEFVVHSLMNFCRNYNKCKLDHRNLHKCAKGERTHHHGYKCRYCAE